jgi:stress-induced-phosphoprotein 1
MKRYDDAVEAYTAGQDVAPEDEGLQRGLAEVQAARDSAERRSSASSSPSDPLRNAFGENVMGRLAGHPKFGAYLGDPVFVQRLQAMQANPSSLGQGVNDPRLMEVFGFLLGFDMAGGAGFGNRGGGSGGGAASAAAEAAAAEAEGGYETDDEDLPPSPPRRGTAAAAAAAAAAAEGKSSDDAADADTKGSKESDDMEKDDVAPRVSAADKKQVLLRTMRTANAYICMLRCKHAAVGLRVRALCRTSQLRSYEIPTTLIRVYLQC